MSIFSKLNRPYTLVEYQTNSPRVKAHLIHFLLASNQPADFVIKQIKSAVEKAGNAVPAKLIQADAENYEWTPLHISVMQGKAEIVLELLAVKSVRDTILARDSKGWTAFHHAAVFSPNSKAIEEHLNKAFLLAKREASKSTKTFENDPGLTYSLLPASDARLSAPGLSVQDIKNYTHLTVESTGMKNVQFQGVPFTAAMVQQFGMTHFRDDLYFPNPRLLWEMSLDGEPLMDPALSRVLATSLSKMANRKLNILPVAEGGYGLFAGQILEPGTVLGVYAGSMHEKINAQRPFADNFTEVNMTNEMYSFCGSNPALIGNHLRFAQCGFLNTSPTNVVHNGVLKTMFVVLREIKVGEQVLFDYGAHYYQLTYGSQKLYQREEMRATYRTEGFEKIAACKINSDLQFSSSKPIERATIRDDLPQYVENRRAEALAQFPLNNPKALLDLHYSDIIPALKWHTAFRGGAESMIVQWKNKFEYPVFYLNLLLEHIPIIDRTISTKSQAVYPLFKQWMLDHLEATSLMDLSKAMSWIAQEMPLTAREFPAFAKTIEERLKTYDWKSDESNLYSYTSRKAQLNNGFNIITSQAYMRSMMTSAAKSFKDLKIAELQSGMNNSTAINPTYIGSEIQKMHQELLAETQQASEQELLVNLANLAV